MRRTGSIVAVAAIAAGVAGCGGSSSNGEASKSPSTIISDSQRAASSAKFVHVSGTVTQSGKQIGVDLDLASGTGAKGTLSQNGSSVQLIRIGTTAYIQASPAFYRQFGAPAAAAQLLKGKWLKAPANRPDLASLTSLTDPSQLFSRLLNAHGPNIQKGGETTVNGQKAVVLKDSNAKGQLNVATTGKPYPVSITGPTGQFSFTNWNKSVSITAPPNSIDTSQLGG